MILYYVPGACSLAVHIALIESAFPYQLIRVGRDKRSEDGRDFMSINPKGYVPALQLEDGVILTENLAILAYIAQQGDALRVAEGLAHWRALEATSFMTTELHGNFKPFFFSDASESERDKARRMLVKRFATLAAQLGEGPFLLGERLSMADPYLFVMLMWAARHRIEVSRELDAHFARMKARPSVQRALAKEGLT